MNVQHSSLLVTSLEEYKQKGGVDATPYSVVTLYPDMAESKDLVLVRLEMMDVQVTQPQLQQIWHIIKRCYIHDADAFAAYPEAFNRKPNPHIDFERYLAFCADIVRDLRIEQTKKAEEEVPEAEFVFSDDNAQQQQQQSSDSSSKDGKQ